MDSDDDSFAEDASVEACAEDDPVDACDEWLLAYSSRVSCPAKLLARMAHATISANRKKISLLDFLFMWKTPPMRKYKCEITT